MIVKIALAAAAAVFALIFLGASLWFLGELLVLALEAVPLKPQLAMLITGAVGLVLAVLLGLTAKSLVSPHRRPGVPAIPAARQPTSSGVDDLAVTLGAMIAQKFASKTRSHPYQTMGAALAAGLAVGIVPELRKLITDLIARRR